jgi:hypothetical protein
LEDQRNAPLFKGRVEQLEGTESQLVGPSIEHGNLVNGTLLKAF